MDGESKRERERRESGSGRESKGQTHGKREKVAAVMCGEPDARNSWKGDD